MSERITHTAVLDDCFRLVGASDAICDTFKAVANEHLELARLASATRSGDSFTVPLLERLRTEWPHRKPEDGLEPRLAFVLGWLCHRAADRQMKPVFRAADQKTGKSPTDCSIYHDVHVLKKVYGVDPESPYSESAAGAATPCPAEQWEIMRDVFHTLLQQSLIELHTLVPDPEDAWGWIDRLRQRQQGFGVDITRYARALADPDPDKVKRYIEETHFYSEDDAMVGLAREIQGGGAVDSERIDAATRCDPESHYGQALSKAFMYVVSAGSFFEGRIDTAQLQLEFDIGQSGSDGKPV